jgi:hypothetical protein
VIIGGWFETGGGNYQIETITATNGAKVLNAGEVNSLISQMAAFAAQVRHPSAVRPFELPPEFQLAVNSIWHSAWNGTGP